MKGGNGKTNAFGKKNMDVTEMLAFQNMKKKLNKEDEAVDVSSLSEDVERFLVGEMARNYDIIGKKLNKELLTRCTYAEQFFEKAKKESLNQEQLSRIVDVYVQGLDALLRSRGESLGKVDTLTVESSVYYSLNIRIVFSGLTHLLRIPNMPEPLLEQLIVAARRAIHFLFSETNLAVFVNAEYVSQPFIMALVPSSSGEGASGENDCFMRQPLCDTFKELIKDLLDLHHKVAIDKKYEIVEILESTLLILMLHPDSQGPQCHKMFVDALISIARIASGNYMLELAQTMLQLKAPFQCQVVLAKTILVLFPYDKPLIHLLETEMIQVLIQAVTETSAPICELYFNPIGLESKSEDSLKVVLPPSVIENLRTYLTNQLRSFQMARAQPSKFIEYFRFFIALSSLEKYHSAEVLEKDSELIMKRFLAILKEFDIKVSSLAHLALKCPFVWFLGSLFR